MAWLPSASTRSKTARPRPVMNVTPLVDVVLVLLIIFMVVIPAMSDSLNIKVPGLTHVDEQIEEKQKPFLLSVTADGDIYLEDEEIPLKNLIPVLRKASTLEPGRRLVLRGDGEAPYGRIRTVYRAVQEVGFPGVSLRVNKRPIAQGE